MPDFKLSFEGLDEEPGTITVPLFLNKLEILQNLNFLIGGYNEKRPFNTTNFVSRKKSTLKDYTLLIKSINKGSTEIVLSPVYHQTSFDDAGTAQLKVVQSMEMIYDFFDHMNSEFNPKEYMSSIIEDSRYRNKIEKLLTELCPKESDNFTIKLINNQKEPLTLNGSLRSKIENTIDTDLSEEKETFYCPVLGLNYQADKNDMKSFITYIEGRKFTIPVNAEIYEKLAKHPGSVFEIECSTKTNELNEIVKVFDIVNAVKRNSIELWDICADKCYSLVKPLVVNIVSTIEKDTYWYLKNDDLDIISMEKDWNDAYKAFAEEFDVLVEEYVYTDDELSPAAQALRTKILRYLGE